jgi:hypothetical protein
MSTERTIKKEQDAPAQSTSGEPHAINPFDKSGPATDKQTMEEEAAAEQQRKEALTERD